MEELQIGVTKPRRAKLAPGGPVDAFAWKVVPPGRPSGFWESYKSEIAAYELDKLLGLDMVPPTVERKVNNYARRRRDVVLPHQELRATQRGPHCPAAVLSPHGTASSRGPRCSTTSLATKTRISATGWWIPPGT